MMEATARPLAGSVPDKKQISFEDTGERRQPRDGEWYTALVSEPSRPEHYAILKEVRNDFTIAAKKPRPGLPHKDWRRA